MRDVIHIVMPVYNASGYLHRTLASVADQSYPYYELVAVDDGSSDGSLEIVESFRENLAGLKIIKQKHAGVSAARNQGLKYVFENGGGISAFWILMICCTGIIWKRCGRRHEAFRLIS